MNSEYRALFEHVADGDHEGYAAIYDDILEEYEDLQNSGISAEQAYQTATTRMKAAKRQFTGLVSLSSV